MSSISKALLGLLLLSLVGCGVLELSKEAPSLTLETDRSSYKPGETVRVTLMNGTSRDIRYEIICPYFLEVQMSTGWSEPRVDDQACIALSAITTVRSGKKSTGEARLPIALSEGVYRFGLEVMLGDAGGDTLLFTPGFNLLSR